MRAVSIFSGAGGFDLAARAAGVEVLRSVERDADCCATLAAAGFHPACEDVGNVGTWGQGLGPVDLVFGGPPCQPFSVAGKGEGGNDERDGFPAAIEVARVLRPRWLVLENVGGFLSPRFALYREQLLHQLRALFPVVSCWRLDAADQGVPQHRRRVFVVAGPSKVRPPSPTHCDPAKPDLWGRLKPWRTWDEALALPATGLILGSGLKGSDREPGKPAPTLRDGNGTAGYYIESRNSGARPVGRHPPGSPSPAVLTPGAGSYDRLVLVGAGETGQGRPQASDRPAPAITTKGTAYVMTAERASSDSWRRRLTVAECAILQDFPTGYPFAGSGESQYRQVGNAVPVRLGAAVLSAVAAADIKLRRAA